jgi:hypothetical protein
MNKVTRSMAIAKTTATAIPALAPGDSPELELSFAFLTASAVKISDVETVWEDTPKSELLVVGSSIQDFVAVSEHLLSSQSCRCLSIPSEHLFRAPHQLH